MADISKTKHKYILEASQLLDSIRISCHQLIVQTGKQRSSTLKEMKKNCNRLLILAEIAFPQNIKVIKKYTLKVIAGIDTIHDQNDSGLPFDLNNTVESMLSDLSSLESPTEINWI